MNMEQQETGLLRAICRDCGTIKDVSYDNRICRCGGVFHVDSARCSGCGKRHPFSMVGKSCSCDERCLIVAKVARCPGCGNVTDIAMAGRFCPSCNMEIVMEG